MAATNEQLSLCYDPFSAEAIAVSFGLNLAKVVGCSKLEGMSDNVKVVSALKDGTSSLVASAIFDDCYYMSLDFNHVVYDHCNRESNQVAYELARLAKYSPPSIWMDSPPNEVVPLVVNDATLLTE